MQVTIKASDVTLTDDIKEEIETKMMGLTKYYKNILKAVVNVSRDNNKRKQGKIFRFAVDVVVPGEDIHAQSMEEDLNMSLNEVIRDLSRLLKKKKEKENDKSIRQGREMGERAMNDMTAGNEQPEDIYGDKFEESE